MSEDTMNIPFKRKRLVVKTIDPVEEQKKEQQKVLQKQIEIEKNSNFVVVDDLASDFMFYDDDITKIHIRPLLLKDVVKIEHANVQKNLMTFVEAISSTIAEDMSILSFTVGDFFQILYWLRLNSYFEAKFTYNLVCTDSDHIDKIVKDELDVGTLYTEETFTTKDLKIKRIEDKQAVLDYTYKIYEDYNLVLRPQTVKDFIEYKQLEDEISEMFINEKFGGAIQTVGQEKELAEMVRNNTTLKMAQTACFLSHHHGDTLKDKVEFLVTSEVLPPAIRQQIDKYVELTYHGVEETVTGKCKECGAPIETQVSVDALTFFS